MGAVKIQDITTKHMLYSNLMQSHASNRLKFYLPASDHFEIVHSAWQYLPCTVQAFQDMLTTEMYVMGEPFRRFYFNSLRPRQNGRHFANDIFKCIFLNENV